MSVRESVNQPRLDPDLFKREAIDADTRAFNDELSRKLAGVAPL
jgi:hypothetical protein